MGSIPGRANSEGSRLGFTFSAPGQDSGVIGVTLAPTTDFNGHAYRIWPVGWEKFSFQLQGSGVNYAITVWGTFDLQTALGNAQNWFQLPGNATDATSAQWSNPMYTGNTGTPSPTSAMLSVKAPLVALRATSDSAPGTTATGTVQFRYLVTS